MASKTNCPDCNCSDGFITDQSPEGQIVKGKSFCLECGDFVKLVTPGTLWRRLRKEVKNAKSKNR